MWLVLGVVAVAGAAFSVVAVLAYKQDEREKERAHAIRLQQMAMTREGSDGGAK